MPGEPHERIELTVRGPGGEVVGRVVRQDGRVVEVEEEDAADPLAVALMEAFAARREGRRHSC